MRALRCERLSEDLSGVALATLGPPAPGPGEVRVSMRAAALNYPDLLMSQGTYQHRPALPFTLGMEGAGVIEARGAGVEGWQVGDAVCVSVRTGAIAEQAVVPVAALSPVPSGWTWAEAAAWQVGGLTALVALQARGALQAGETLLVHGATGGMGAAAVAVGAAMGAQVIATGSRPDWLARLRPLGARHLLSSREPFAEAVKALTQGRGADVIFDPVGGAVFEQSTHCIAFGGRLLVVGFAAGQRPTVAANHVLIKSYAVVGVRAGEWLRQRPQDAPRLRETLARLAAADTLRPLIGAVFPFEAGRAALQALRDRTAPGKIVIEIAPS